MYFHSQHSFSLSLSYLLGKTELEIKRKYVQMHQYSGMINRMLCDKDKTFFRSGVWIIYREESYFCKTHLISSYQHVALFLPAED